MKTLLTLCVLAAVLASPAAFARGNKFYTIDMSGKRFVSDGFNAMGDDLLGDDYNGIQIKLSGVINEDFAITVSASNPADAKECRIGRSKVISNFTLVEILGTPETDGGDTCDYTIVYRNGRKAVLKVESTGT